MMVRSALALFIGLLFSACSSGSVGSGGGGEAGASAGPGGSSMSGAGGTQAAGAGGSAGGVPFDATDPSCRNDVSMHTGDGTYYDATGDGNCMFGPSPTDLMVGAMNHADYAASAVCGTCVALTGPKGSTQIRIVDQCPECLLGAIDLSPEAFDSIADHAAGRVTIT